MREHPIIFSAPMVRAILEGRKTQTRRAIKPQPFYKDGIWGNIAYPFGCKMKVGDRLWVRETWAKTCIDPTGVCDGEGCDYCSWNYRADDPTAKYPGDWPDNTPSRECPPRWKPSIFMPRAASRILLEISEVRVQQLHEISRTDAIAEGVGKMIDLTGHIGNTTPETVFASLWMHIYGLDSWQANPFVWAITFSRCG